MNEISKSINMFVVVKTSFEALHCWQNIPSAHKSQFLKYPHRHKFNFELTFRVFHDDRDLEFFELKDLIDRTLIAMYPKQEDELLPNLGSMSCEMLAENLLLYFKTLNCVTVKVIEDDENAGIATLFNQV